MSTRLAVLVLAALPLGTACSDGAGARQPAAVVRDSAGISIVENAGPQLDTTEAWRVSSEPLLEIGAADGPEEETFHNVLSAVEVGDRIAVLNGGTREIRFFDAQGNFVHAVGGDGDGPGEFRGLFSLQPIAGDTLVAFDLQKHFVAIYDPDGRYVRMVRLEPPDAAQGILYLGRLPDGTYLTRGGINPMHLDRGTGRMRGAGWVSRMDATGASLGHVLEFDDSESLLTEIDGSAVSMSVPFGGRMFMTLAGGAIASGYTDDYEIRYHAADGSLLRIARRTAEPVPVTTDEAEAYRENYRESRGERGPSWSRALVFPEHYPNFGSIIADAEGNVWVEAYRKPGVTGPTDWSVFDAEGRWVTDVTTPAGFRVTYIGPDRILGVWRDDMNVEYVRVYSLDRS